MNDRLDNEVSVGDRVIYSTGYNQLEIGHIIKINEKTVKIEGTDDTRHRAIHRLPSGFLKI